jgi:hypothetical protein
VRTPPARFAARAFGLWLGLAAAAVSAGCVSAEGELADVDVTYGSLVFPGAGAAAGREGTGSVPFRQKPPRLGLPKTAFESVRVLSITVTPTGGVSDLTFIRSARILATADGGDEAIEIGRYERADDTDVMPVLVMTNVAPVDVTSLWTATAITFTVEVTGVLPAAAWSADLVIKLDARLRY